MSTPDVDKAIGLTYDSSDLANKPKVAVKAEGQFAQTIIDKAKELGIYVHKDPTLLKNLENLKEGDEIPKTLFIIIAEIIAYSYFLQGKVPEQWKDKNGKINIRRKV